MADLPPHARVVVIGGGAVGVSALYHLALAGWTDALLLEAGELTSGSTWHAAGNCPTFSTSWSLMNLQRYSAALYRDLGARVGYPMNYHVTGSLRLAHSADRMLEFERARGMGAALGMGLELLGPGDLKPRYPFLETHDLAGALWDPSDGDIDPAQLTQALATGARALGATIRRFCPVTAAARAAGEWVLTTPDGEVRCEVVVNAAGYRAAEVGAMFGRTVPMAVMSHQYLLTEPIAELAAWSAEAGHKLPLLRDVDTSYYLRQEKTGFNLGPYERACRAHWTDPADPMPADFSFQLFPDDLDRLEPYIADAMARVPLLATAGVAKVINGPIPYTPDGNPLIGPMPGVPGAFEACVFTFGIAQAGGAGKVLAEWVTSGGTEWDMWSCDPRRFGPWCDPGYCRDKAVEVYGHEYAIQYPRHAWPAARDRRRSAVHDRVAALGAVFGATAGWERALWYAEPGDDTTATQTWDRDGPWAPRVREECLAVRDAAGILDLPGFSRFRLEGPGAAAWLEGIITGRAPAPGRIGLAYFLDPRGRLVTEMTVMRISEDLMFLITAAVAQAHDFDWLRAALAPGLDLTDVTEDFACQILTGPAARAILAEVTDADLAKPWLTHQTAQIAGRYCQLARVSFAGELGWEIHSKTADTPAIWDAVWAAGQGHGLRPFGMWALDALRIEKGYRAWKGDLSTDYTPLELGLERFIRLDKPVRFPGQDAVEAEGRAGPARRLVQMILGPCAQDAPYMANVWRGGERVGEVTSAAWGHRVGAQVALAMLRADCTAPGCEVEVEVFGARVPGTVQPDAPLWDPRNERLRA